MLKYDDDFGIQHKHRKFQYVIKISLICMLSLINQTMQNKILKINNEKIVTEIKKFIKIC